MTGRWTPAAMPDLTGSTAVVTGANSGLGLHTALELARHGARVVMSCRSPERGAAALDRVRTELQRPAQVELRPLDLADLSSVRSFAAALTGPAEPLDLLVNNAGVMAIPQQRTADGFEMQLGTNHLGHFALTGLLLPALLKGAVAGGPPRVVTVSSGLHRRGTLHRDDLMGEGEYKPWGAYSQSKLANLLFMRELQRRADAAGARLISVAAHPGYAATNLQHVGPQLSGRKLDAMVSKIGNAVFAQSAEKGAWPTLRAATDPEATGGDYYGPDRLFEQRGNPTKVGMSGAAQDDADALWLWDRSAELTGVDFAGLGTAAT